MPLIFRATKAGSTDGNYVPNVIIQSAEVNLDFNELYELVDGDLDNVNIAAGAGIVYSKLNLTGGIVNADVSATAAIDYSKLNVPDRAIPRVKLATTPTISAAVTGGLAISTEDVVVALAPITTVVGDVIQIQSACMLSFRQVNVTGLWFNVNVTFRWKVNDGMTTTTIFTSSVTVIVPPTSVVPPPIPWTLPLTPPGVSHIPGAGTFVYAMTAEATAPGQVISTATPGSVYLMVH